MLRQKYQEKFIKNKKEIEHIETEIKEVFYLFEELYEEINKKENEVNTIQDNIQTIKGDIKKVENSIIDIEETNNSYLYYAFIGGGLGSFALIYNPYIGIGSILGGMIISTGLGYIHNMNIS